MLMTGLGMNVACVPSICRHFQEVCKNLWQQPVIVHILTSMLPGQQGEHPADAQCIGNT